MLKTFTLGFLFALSLQLVLAIAKETGLGSHNSWNLPGLILMLASIPWPVPVISYIFDRADLIGHHLAEAIMQCSVSIGFGINLTLIHYAYKKLHSIRKGKSTKVVR